jgi:hypothetical protein
LRCGTRRLTRVVIRESTFVALREEEVLAVETDPFDRAFAYLISIQPRREAISGKEEQGRACSSQEGGQHPCP